jgi:hypothetical protein
MVQQVQSIESGIPTALEPFYTGIAKEGTEIPGQGLIPLAYKAYFPSKEFGTTAYDALYAPVINAGLMGAGAVAPMSTGQQAVGRELQMMGTPTQFGMGTEAAQMAGMGYQGLAGLQALGVQAPTLGGAQTFTSDVSQQYMSPYQQGVLDIAKRSAIEDAQKAQLGQNLAAARQGTYGGARQALLQGQRESGLRTQLSDIQVKGLQDAYAQAQAQFERDRAATMGREQFSAGQDLTAQQLNQAAAAQAAQTRLGAVQGLGGLASAFGALGTTQQAADLDRLKTLGAYGDLQRGIEQQAMDAQRAALLDRALYGQTQVGQLSNLLRGIPTTTTSQTTTTPPPSFASQLTGLGLTGLSLYNMLGGGK